MMRRAAPAALSRPTDQRQLFELLAERHRALLREWRLFALQDAVDDDLLPARRRLEDALVEVSLAMDRFKSGTYGDCTGCGGRIDFQRLLTHPAAARCWPCQLAAEQRGQDSLPH